MQGHYTIPTIAQHPRQESNLIYDLRKVACGPAHSEDIVPPAVPRPGIEPGPRLSKSRMMSVSPPGQRGNGPWRESNPHLPGASRPSSRWTTRPKSKQYDVRESNPPGLHEKQAASPEAERRIGQSARRESNPPYAVWKTAAVPPGSGHIIRRKRICRPSPLAYHNVDPIRL